MPIAIAPLGIIIKPTLPMREGTATKSTHITTRGLAQIVPTVCGTGDVPLERCLAILKAVGYDGCVSIEYEGALDCIAALTMGLSNLTKAFERI